MRFTKFLDSSQYVEEIQYISKLLFKAGLRISQYYVSDFA